MNRKHKHIVISSVLAGLGLIAAAQTPPSPPPANAPAAPYGRHDGARFKERMAARQAELKQKLQITTAQEPAWNAWVAAMQPPANLKRPDPAEFEKLTTPERIDRLRELRTERLNRMDQRGEATKKFYAGLSADQKKVFDAETLRLLRPEGGGWGNGRWGHRRG